MVSSLLREGSNGMPLSRKVPTSHPPSGNLTRTWWTCPLAQFGMNLLKCFCVMKTLDRFLVAIVVIKSIACEPGMLTADLHA